jgi:hypothetical protein
MAIMSPLRYRLSLIKRALSWDNEIIYEVLAHHRLNLPNTNIQVSWVKDGEYIVGTIKAGTESFMTQGRTAKEFVEMVNDALYAVFGVPPEYAQALGGDYRLVPNDEEFQKLNNAAVRESSLKLGHLEVPA